MNNKSSDHELVPGDKIVITKIIELDQKIYGSIGFDAMRRYNALLGKVVVIDENQPGSWDLIRVNNEGETSDLFIEYAGHEWAYTKISTVNEAGYPIPSGGDEGKKYDTSKTMFELLPVEGLEEIAKVLTFGANKYEADNWRKGMAWRRLIGGLWRHVSAWAMGEDKDPETGLNHLAHAGCCILFLLCSQLNGYGTDDRIKLKRNR